jgi:hypothetical protein
LTLSIVEKILNDPIVLLKRKSERPQAAAYLDLARRLFNLDPENDEEAEYGHSGDDTESQGSS